VLVIHHWVIPERMVRDDQPSGAGPA